MLELTVSINRENKSKLSCDLVFPSNWDELNEKQFLYIAKYWQSWQHLASIGESLRAAKAMLLLKLCGINSKRELKRLCTILSFINEHNTVNIFDTVEFVFKKLKLTKNHLPKIKFGFFTSYVGPGDRLNDISIEEFSFAYSAYLQYNRTGETKHLNNLVAVLYRPPSEEEHEEKTGENRIPFNYKLIDRYAKKSKWVKDEAKQGVLLFFMGCLAYFEKKYPEVFKRAEKNEKAGTATFFDTIVDLSGGELGPFKDTKDTNLHVALQLLNKKIRNSKKKVSK